MAVRKKPRPNAIRRGFLSKKDKEFIGRNRHKMTAELMAQQLRRAPAQVQQYLDENQGEDAGLVISPTLSAELEHRPEWEQFRQQFDSEELKYLKYRYVQLMNQFGKDDVLPTEEMQIFQLITLELMTMASMRERKTLITQQKLAQAELDLHYNTMECTDPQEGAHKSAKKAAAELEAKFTDISAGLKGINQRHESYTMRQNRVLNDLKATRDQRVNVAQNSKQSFLGFLKLLQVQEERAKINREIELARLAMDKETQRIAAEIEYVDGTKDQPLLTPETVI